MTEHHSSPTRRANDGARMRFHYYRQQWLATPQARHWQRFHFFWPNGQRRGIGVTVWAHEFSLSLRGKP